MGAGGCADPSSRCRSPRAVLSIHGFTALYISMIISFVFSSPDATCPPALKHKFVLVFRDVPQQRLLSGAFWLVLLQSCVWGDPAYTSADLYETLLPFLNERPLESNYTHESSGVDVQGRMAKHKQQVRARQEEARRKLQEERERRREKRRAKRAARKAKRRARKEKRRMKRRSTAKEDRESSSSSSSSSTSSSDDDSDSSAEEEEEDYLDDLLDLDPNNSRFEALPLSGDYSGAVLCLEAVRYAVGVSFNSPGLAGFTVLLLRWELLRLACKDLETCIQAGSGPNGDIRFLPSDMEIALLTSAGRSLARAAASEALSRGCVVPNPQLFQMHSLVSQGLPDLFQKVAAAKRSLSSNEVPSIGDLPLSAPLALPEKIPYQPSIHFDRFAQIPDTGQSTERFFFFVLCCVWHVILIFSLFFSFPP